MDATKSEQKANNAVLSIIPSGGRRESKYSAHKNVVWTVASKSEPKEIPAVHSIRESWSKNVVWTGATKSEPKAKAAVQSIRES